jgi:hypothetical protein
VHGRIGEPCLIAVALAGGARRHRSPQAHAASTQITAAAARHAIQFRRSTGVIGRVTGDPGGDGGVRLDLQADPYPYGGFTTRESILTAADGSYRFGVSPSRNTRYRVVLGDTPDVRSPPVAVTVNDLLSTHVRYETPGRAGRHPQPAPRQSAMGRQARSLLLCGGARRSSGRRRPPGRTRPTPG